MAGRIRFGACLLAALVLSGVLWPLAPVTRAEGLAFPPAGPESQGIRAEALEELAGEVRGYFDEQQIVGAELLVIKNRRTVRHEVVGWKDLPDRIPMELNTIFNIRSMAKPIIGAATQVLIDEGKLALDDRVARFLPSLDNEKSREITLEHLLTHRGGFPQASPPGPLTKYGTLRGLADYWGKLGPDQFAPGQGFTYSDPGVDILGAVLEEVSGQSLKELVEERIFKPTGMADSFAMTDNQDPRRGRISSNHTGSRAPWRRYWKPSDGPLAPFVKGSGTSWYSTARDYARFLALWMDGGVAGTRRLLTEDAVRRALTPVSVMESLPTTFPGLKTFYGQLWFVYAGGELTSQAETVAFGHCGSDGTWAWAWPEHDLMVLYFTQSRGNRTGFTLERAIDRLLVNPKPADTSRTG